MAMFVNILILLVLAVTLVLSVFAVIRGYKGMKMSRLFETSDKKVKIGYWLVSAVHMWTGIVIIICYAIAALLILAQL